MQESAVEGLFGQDRHYPDRRPAKKVQMQQSRSWRLWHNFTALWFTMPLWLAFLLIPATILSGDSKLWYGELVGGGAWIFSGMLLLDKRALPEHDQPYMPWFWRSWHGAEKVPYSAGEERVLEAVWSLTAAIDKLEPVEKRLKEQLSDDDRHRISGFATNAREALARGDQALAQSLLEAKADAEEHRQWVEEQLERLAAQLKILRDKRYHLKTKLAIYHMRQEALQAQAEANQARAETMEAIAGTPLQAELELELDDVDLSRLKDEALDAEARVLAMEELGQELPRLPVAELKGPALEKALAELETQVAIKRAGRSA